MSVCSNYRGFMRQLYSARVLGDIRISRPKGILIVLVY